MTITASTIITIASLLTAIGAIFTVVFKVHKWFLKQEKQDEDIKNLKDEQRIICTGVLACLDGLEQLGCNHSVPKAKEKLEEHINNAAHS
ncbi:hypothetical protein [Bacillus infantis]|uniref:hypothetical protein n=1 Tax=Bacillus infantis TaxID=324767 RepID=UPI003CE6B1FB